MSKKTRVALTMRVTRAQGYEESRDAISHDFIRYFQGLGYTPVLIPNTLEKGTDYFRSTEVDALVLTGGNDINPELYGQDADFVSNDSFSPERDATETGLLEYAVKNRVALLGICRGMQFINVFFGGRLEHELGRRGDASVSHVASTHTVAISHPLLSGFISRTEITVNSYHNHGVIKEGIGRDLDPFAASIDGVIEGLVHRELPILGLQWHPEREGPPSEIDERIIRGVIEGKLFRGRE